MSTDWIENNSTDLADELEKVGIVLTPDHDVGDLLNLMNEIGLLFDGDLVAACEAIRTRQLTFEPIPDWWQVQRN